MTKTTKRALDRVGKVYHELTVVELVGRNKHSHLMWKCLCSCGNYKTLPSGELGRAKSCGCLKKDLTRTLLTQATQQGLRS